jgi:16S rRNA (guanine527-N7)-methyltransferase
VTDIIKEEKLETSLSALGIPNADGKARLMLGYMALTLERNEIINLTTVTEEDEFIERHLMDSLAVYGLPELGNARRVIDVGAGAGFPGVPLAIACPDKEFLLIDSLGKRTQFITKACEELGVKNVRAQHVRAEDAARSPLRESFDLAVSRAVGHLSVLCEYTLPFVQTGGAMYAYKSKNQTDEIDESLKARLMLGAAKDVEIRSAAGRALRDVEILPAAGRALGETVPRDNAIHPTNNKTKPLYSIPSRHIIIIIQKERPTPDAYPRRAGTPSKVPL